MAVLPKHKDQNPHYNPDDDMTLDQLQRFTRAANHAQQKREELEEQERPSIIEVARRARRAERRPLAHPQEKIHPIRYAIWLVIVAVIALGLMYVAG